MDIRASVALAAYNGEKYIEEQIASILVLMGPDDEIVVSDDGSGDSTVDIIERIKAKDDRVRLFHNVAHGVGKNFENAIRHCRGKYIFYSDQDDIWLDDKINKCVRALEESGCAIVVHDGYYTDADLNYLPYNGHSTFFDGKTMSSNPLRIFVKNRAATLGCCMCFRSSCIPILLPIPINSHDTWTVWLLSWLGGVSYVYEILLLHRMHGANVTVPHRRSLPVIAASRAHVFAVMMVRVIRYRMHGKL